MTSEEDDKIMKLERNIPARKEIIKFGWVRKDFLKYSESFKNIRSNMSQKMDKCFWCKHNFLDNEPIALAQIIGKRNVVLCNNCADKLLPPKEQDNDKPDISSGKCTGSKRYNKTRGGI